MAKIKICGITKEEDASLAMSLGADYLGFNFYKESARKVSPKMVDEIMGKLPPFVVPVGVFVDEDPKEIGKVVKRSGIKMLQLHGSESPEVCKSLKETYGLPIIKGFRVADASIIETIKAYVDVIDYVLVDTFVEGEAGGTGKTFDWEIALKAKELGKPLFLAGGLTPENVEEAVEKVNPFAVDTASGVERLPRRKDYDKMKAFIRAAKGL
jgi:phosphoribosylanthranilate isomerase